MDDRDAVAQQIARFISAYNAADLDGVMQCYSADLVKTRQGAAPESYDETRERIGNVMRTFSGDLTVVNEELVVSDGLAYTRGTLRLVLTPRAGGAPQTVERRFLEVWRRENGEWRVARTMDNEG